MLFISVFGTELAIWPAEIDIHKERSERERERLSSLNFALWANILSNLNKYRVLFSWAPVCIALSEPQNFQEHSPSQPATHSFLSSAFFIQFGCSFSIHAGHFSVAIEETRRKRTRTPSFSIEKNLFQLNSKWAEWLTICSKCSEAARMFVNIVGDWFCEPTDDDGDDDEWLALCNNKTKSIRIWWV